MTLVVVAWLGILGLVASLVLAAATRVERNRRTSGRKRWRRAARAPGPMRVISGSKADGSRV